MSGWLPLRNGEAAPLDRVPLLAMGELVADVVARCEEGERPVAFFGVPAQEVGLGGEGGRGGAPGRGAGSEGGVGPERAQGSVLLMVALADDRTSLLSVASARLSRSGRGSSYPSLTSYVPAFHHFERELHEEFGVEPSGHPWLKPVRYPASALARGDHPERYPFFAATGEGVHEVAVGPVHAGVIEPGHFRFMCRGETVDHLEIQLGYQHRGVESLFREGRLAEKAPLAESIAGDSTVAHATAYLLCVEALAGFAASPGARHTRSIALELERIAVHLGTLSALAGDVAYLTGSALFGGVRTMVINATLAVCGSRFGRGWLRPGGDRYAIDRELSLRLEETLATVEHRTRRGAEVMFNSPSVLSRFQGTGRIERSIAAQIGMVGLAARACGLPRDIRRDHPIPGVPTALREVPTLDSGDVYARAYLRFLEINRSIDLVRTSLAYLAGRPEALQGIERTGVGPLAPDSIVLSLVEGHRGEIVHAALTDGAGRCARYKIKDPSFNNWFALALAVRGEGVSDFPLCNKSFDLSYAGHDL